MALATPCLQVRVWDAVTGEQVKKMGEHKDIVNRWARWGAGAS